MTVLWHYFKDQCDNACPNQEVQCNCLVDIAYNSNQASKVTLWRLSGRQMILNLLEKSGNKIHYPVETDLEFCDFVYMGRGYGMVEAEVAT